MENNELKVYDTITIDQNNPDPFTRVSGDIYGPVIQWIRQNSHRVLAKKTAEGEVVYCRLSDSGGVKYHDGTPADLTGPEGDVFVKLPKFYYVGTEGDKVDITFSAERISNDQIEWDENILIGAYEAYLDGDELRSISGVESTGSISQEDFKKHARNRGAGYQLVDWQMHCVLGCLYYAMYGNTDCQGTIGAGTSEYRKPTGQTDYLGMRDAIASTNGNTHSINFWGLENWWGNKFEWIDDYINPAGTLTATVNDPATEGVRGFPIKPFDGWYVKKMKFGKYLDLVNIGIDSSKKNNKEYYCDYQYWPGNTSSLLRVARRSSHYSGTDGGVAFAVADDASSITSSCTGSRLAFRGISREAESVEAFKLLKFEKMDNKTNNKEYWDKVNYLMRKGFNSVVYDNDPDRIIWVNHRFDISIDIERESMRDIREKTKCMPDVVYYAEPSINPDGTFEFVPSECPIADNVGIWKNFKSFKKDGPPAMKKGYRHSNNCLCFVDGGVNGVDRFLVAYYHYGIEGDEIYGCPKWVCHQAGGIKYLNVSYYMELPDVKEFKNQKHNS